MAYITVAEAKKHLNIESAFTDDDTYIASLTEVAQAIIARKIDCSLTYLEDKDGHIPTPLKHAMLLIVGQYYAIREDVSSTNMSIVPNSVDMICDLYHKYDNTKKHLD